MKQHASSTQAVPGPYTPPVQHFYGNGDGTSTRQMFMKITAYIVSVILDVELHVTCLLQQ